MDATKPMSNPAGVPQNTGKATGKVQPWVVYSAALMMLTSVLAVASKSTVVDLDLFHELALIRQTVDEGAVPLADAFAYTPTISPVVHHEWGTGAVLYAAIVASGLGAGGLMALKYLLTFGLCISCFHCARLKGCSFEVFLILSGIALCLCGNTSFSTIRAQMFTLLFLAWEFMLLEWDRRGSKKWILPWLILVVVWSNMHGGVVAGMGIFGVYCATRFWAAFNGDGEPAKANESESPSRSIAKRFQHALVKCQYLVWTGLATLAALLINPYGLEYPVYLFRALLMERPLIAEWHPFFTFVDDLHTISLFVISLLIAVAAFWNKTKTHLFAILTVTLTAWLTLKHARHLSLYTVAWICLVPAAVQGTLISEHLSAIWNRMSRKFVVAAMIYSLIAVGVAVKGKFWELQVPSEPGTGTAKHMYYPAGPVEYMRKTGFTGNLMVPFESGAFVSWSLYPSVKVSIDSRYEVVYPPGALEEAVAFYRAQDGWRETLKRYPTDAVLVPSQKSLNGLLEKDANWHLHYRDRGFSLFLREPPANAATDTPEIRTSQAPAAYQILRR